ncbi:MAG: NAD-dependent epimerase/dehydratase family protein, partial [Candidatus Cloacimonetes bacterium]|nr:NAD-dependent epimerase/dehydratase family protein [Candidatus Cloacimonadota bacterium]
EFNPDLVNHHAARISVPESVRDPLQDAEVNVLGWLNVLQSCVASDVQKVIYISSGGAVYGEAAEYPTSENYRPAPRSPYAIHKYIGEEYLVYYHLQHGLKYTVLRYANVYGPRQIPQSEAGVVSIFINSLLQGDIPRVCAYEGKPEGMYRDYIYVKDIIEANVAVLSEGENETFNVGTGKPVATMDLYRQLLSVMDLEITPEKAAARPGDLHRSCLNIEKIGRITGWKPVWDLRSGLQETVNYFQRKEKER